MTTTKDIYLEFVKLFIISKTFRDTCGSPECSKPSATTIEFPPNNSLK